MMRSLWWQVILFLVLLLLSCWIQSILLFVQSTNVSFLGVLQWSIAQWSPSWPPVGRLLQDNAWNVWNNNNNNAAVKEDDIVLECPILDLSHNNDYLPPLPLESLVESVESQYGNDWRDRPLLLKGLWNRDELEADNINNRRLSLRGLLDEKLIIPYFYNASTPYALSPDGMAPTYQIVQNMTDHGWPHKIGTQLLVQTYPDLIHEVAPTDIVTALFGNHFEPHHVIGPFGGLLPPTTTVPVFVAKTTGSIRNVTADGKDHDDDQSTTCEKEAESDDAHHAHARTDLHSEPIGNVAVQLRGEKQWLLISPQYSFRIRPTLAPDGRAFFASFASQANLRDVPRYHVTTRAGDALWIPSWTWHRVDYYVSSDRCQDDIAIGASLFHFRPLDFVRNNPLFAMLVVPSLIKELVGYNTQ